jgi:ParB/RepB/Spo0J family partition protein
MAVKGEGLSRGKQLYKIDPRVLLIDESKNYRQEYPEIDELADSIAVNGVLEPVRVRKTKDGSFELTAGYRRMRAVTQLLDRGVKIEAVPCLIEEKGISEENILFANISSNSGVKPTPLELMEAFQRLQNYGVDKKDIAKRIGKSVAYVDYILALKNASPELKTAIKNKEIPITTATKIVKESNGSIAEQKAAIDKTKKDKAAKKANKEAKKTKTTKTQTIGTQTIGDFKLPGPPVKPPYEEPKKQPRAKSPGYQRNEPFDGLVEWIRDEIREFDPQGVDLEALGEDLVAMIEMLETFIQRHIEKEEED